jgi:hypothetical protein
MNYFEKFSTLLTQLQENPFITLKKETIGSAGTEEIRKLLLSLFESKLSEKLDLFYSQINNTKIEWECDLRQYPEIKKYELDDEMLFGCIKIYPMECCFTFDENLKVQHFDDLDEQGKEDLLKFRQFDFNDDEIRVGFFEENGIVQDKIYFIMQGDNGFCDPRIEFEEYIDKLIEHKGFKGWQYNHFFKSSDNSKRMMHYLKQLF